MGKTAFAKIANVPWSTTPETSYDVIVESLRTEGQGNVKVLPNENGDIQVHLQDEKFTEVSFEGTIKGANHFGKNALLDSVITSMSDTEVPVPLIITSNSRSTTRGEWQKCSFTARYYGSDFTTGTLPTTFTTGA